MGMTINESGDDRSPTAVNGGVCPWRVPRVTHPRHSTVGNDERGILPLPQ